MLSIIAAIADNNAIGKNNELLCYLPNDLKHFKEITTGKTIIMGKHTYFSLPRRPLPNRRNIIISSQQNEPIEGVEIAKSIEQAIQLVDTNLEHFIIGGGTIYQQFISLADKLYITHIHHTWQDADTFFPEIDLNIWQETTREHHQADEKNPYPYSFVEYIRK